RWTGPRRPGRWWTRSRCGTSRSGASAGEVPGDPLGPHPFPDLLRVEMSTQDDGRADRQRCQEPVERVGIAGRVDHDAIARLDLQRLGTGGGQVDQLVLGVDRYRRVEPVAVSARLGGEVQVALRYLTQRQ